MISRIFRILACSAWLASLQPAFAAVTRTIAFQGVLETGSTPSRTVQNGTYTVTFRLYLSKEGGPPVWAEAKNVMATGGRGVFTTLLGDTATLANVTFQDSYFLGVTVGSDQEMVPRLPLAGAAYAFGGSGLQLPYHGFLNSGPNDQPALGIVNLRGQGIYAQGGGVGAILAQAIGVGGYGVWGQAGCCGLPQSPGVGVRGTASDATGVGLYAENTASHTQAALATGSLSGDFTGTVHISGNLVVDGVILKGGEALPNSGHQPAQAVSSPRSINGVAGNPGFCTGTATMGPDGTVWVTVPPEMEKRDGVYTYQLTCVGGYAPVYISRELAGSRFRIGGGRSGLKVSWQVTRVR